MIVIPLTDVRTITWRPSGPRPHETGFTMELTHKPTGVVVTGPGLEGESQLECRHRLLERLDQKVADYLDALEAESNL